MFASRMLLAARPLVSRQMAASPMLASMLSRGALIQAMPTAANARLFSVDVAQAVTGTTAQNDGGSGGDPGLQPDFKTPNLGSKSKKAKKTDPQHCSFMKVFSTLKNVQISKRVYELTQQEVLEARDRIYADFQLTKNELKYVASYRPDVLTYGTKNEKPEAGLTVVRKFFIEERKMDPQVIRTLLVKYPALASISREQFEQVFSLFEQVGFDAE